MQASKFAAILVTTLIISPTAGCCQTAVGDSVVGLSEVSVVSYRRNSGMATDSLGATTLSTQTLQRMPKVLGNADPLRIMQSLPGVHTNSEYDSGLHVNGDETSHTVISMEGAPVYGATHLLGFFSVFNPTHFSAMRLQRSSFMATSSNRLGAALDMLLPDTLEPGSMSVEGTVGLMSSQGTAMFNPTARTRVILSARRSYLNLLYGKLLEMEDFSLKYGFGDYNASVITKPTDRDIVKMNFYYGNDNAEFKEYNYQAVLGLDWRNLVASASWEHGMNSACVGNRAWFSQYDCNFSVDEAGVSGQLESGIRSLGWQASLSARNVSAWVQWEHYNILPQNPKVKELGRDAGVRRSSSDVLSSLLAYKCRVASWMSLEMGARASSFLAGDVSYTNIDPFLTISAGNDGFGSLILSSGWKSQHLWQTGFSSRGLPTEFWISPIESGLPPQRAFGVEGSYVKSLYNGTCLIEGRAFYKRLANQLEYKGDILELLNAYDLEGHLVHGKGYNAGASIMVHKAKGRFTGWVAYCWQKTRRTFTPSGGNAFISPANHDRPHEVNALAAYRINRHWDIGATLVYASGTPFTVAREMYLINNAVVTQYGPHNGARLPGYFRVDVSANYDFIAKGNFRHGINISLYNLTAHSNAIFYRLKATNEHTTIRYSAITFALPVMPSISYYFKF